jgi:sigma-B regulation protein RsbU (phosphoserine phosphatase)
MWGSRNPRHPDALAKFADFLEQFGGMVTSLAGRLDRHWQRVTDGFALQDLWSQFKAEARYSYGFYSKEVDWEAMEGQTGWRRSAHIARAFFWAMLTKLPPARRVFLLVGLVLVVVALINNRGEGSILLAAGALLFSLVLELADRVTMKRDLEIARDIQRWLVPARPPEVQGVDIAFTTRPANTVSGDYYDALLRPPLPGRGDGPRLLLAVADVAGKSIPAALLMATIQASLRTLAASPTALPELVAGVNRYACGNSLGGSRFTTAFFAEADRASNKLTFVSAGHNPPILLRSTGEMERLEIGGLPLGIRPEAAYDAGETALAAGDLLVIFTDGVIDAEDEHGQEYGEERLITELKTAPHGCAAEVLHRIMGSVDAFVGATRQHDDITCLVLAAK